MSTSAEPSGPLPSGGRGNGLPASTWAALGECDPRVADELLEMLASVMIPAYAVAAHGIRGANLEIQLPRRPIDRVFVERSRRTEAERLVHNRLQAEGGNAVEDELAAQDRAFREIVAGFSQSPTPGSLPAAEDLPMDAGFIPPLVLPPPPPPTPVRPEPGLLDPGGLLYDSTIGEGVRPRGADPFEGDDNHYVPPPPDPVPPVSKATKAAWTSILVGLFFLIAPSLGVFTSATLAHLIGVALIVGGIGALVYRLKDDKDPFDGDDGARV